MCNFTAYIKFLVKPLKINFKRSFNFLFLKFCRNSHWWKALKIVGSGRIYDGGYFFLSIILQVSVGQQLTAQGLIAQHHILHLEWVKKACVLPDSALSHIYTLFYSIISITCCQTKPCGQPFGRWQYWAGYREKTSTIFLDYSDLIQH